MKYLLYILLVSMILLSCTKHDPAQPATTNKDSVVTPIDTYAVVSATYYGTWINHHWSRTSAKYDTFTNVKGIINYNSQNDSVSFVAIDSNNKQLYSRRDTVAFKKDYGTDMRLEMPMISYVSFHIEYYKSTKKAKVEFAQQYGRIGQSHYFTGKK